MQPTMPIDSNSNQITLTPAYAALARTIDTTISSATSITLNTATKLIEVTAINQGVYLRYQAGVSNSNFDEYISADTTRHFVVPDGVTVISVIEKDAGATVVIIEK